MEIIPAIDVSNGKCVRLYQGLKGTEKVYYEDPLEAIEFWIKKGANRINIIDLDGAWGSDIKKMLFKNMIKKASNKLNRNNCYKGTKNSAETSKNDWYE